MRKVLSFLLMLLAVLTVNAQGKWEKTELEADELKGQEGGVVYIYTQPNMGSFVFWDIDQYQFRLTSDECQFNVKYSGEYCGVVAQVGLYDDNNKLQEKFTLWLDREQNYANRFVRTRNAGGMFNPVGQKGKVKKIFKALQSEGGYVRIVCERYNNTDYDLKILPLKNLE